MIPVDMRVFRFLKEELGKGWIIGPLREVEGESEIDIGSQMRACPGKSGF